MDNENVQQDFFASDAVGLVRVNVATARALLRTLILALEAVEDGAILFKEDPGPARWSNVLSQVCKRLVTVRTALTESVSAPSVDWWTPLNLADALDAALWGAATGKRVWGLEGPEVISAAQAVIDSLDALMEDIQSVEVAAAT